MHYKGAERLWLLGEPQTWHAGNPAAWSNFAVSVSVHAVAGCASGAATGGGCGPGALSAAFSKATTAVTASYLDTKNLGDATIGVAIHAVVGGTAAELGGGKFANGAQTGAFSYLFNELLHQHDGSAAGRRRAMQLSGYGGVAEEGEFGVSWKPNHPATVPVDGAAADALYCTAKCVGSDIYATGGQESSGHSKGSHHYVNEAVDFRSLSVVSSKVLACSANCGFEAGWFESWGTPHWHFQLRPGNNVPRITPDPVIKRPSVKGP